MRSLLRLLALLDRAWAFLRGRRAAADLDEEMAFHLDLKTRENMSAGMTEAEASAAALRSFGSVALAGEDSRAAWRSALLDSIAQDLRYGARALRRSPVFTLTVTLTLALGIGANTAIFTLVDRVLLRPLAVSDPTALIAFGTGSQMGLRQSDGAPDRDATLFSYPLYEDFARHTDVYSGLGAVCSFPITAYLEGGGAATGQPPEQATTLLVTGNLFQVLGAPMALGRPLTPADDTPSASQPAVVLGHGFWTRRFGRDPGIVGRTVRANGVDYTIVGVAAPEFRGLSLGIDADLWVPMVMQPQVMRDESFLADRNRMWLRIIGRLRPGTTEAVALARTNALFRRLVTEEAGSQVAPQIRERIDKLAIGLTPFDRGFSNLRGRWGQPLLVLMSVVGLVLLIACANVGNLLLARASSRRREFSMRLALGAGRGRLVRQLLTESLMVSALGGTVGLLVAHWMVRFLLGVLSSRRAAGVDAGLDARVLLFAVGVTAVAAFLFGLAPALRAARVDLQTALRATAGTSGADRHGWRLRRALVVFQVAVSLCLLVGAGLLLKSLANLRGQDLGYRTDSVVTVELDPQGGGIDPSQAPLINSALLERIGTMPGVSAVSMSLYGLLGGARRVEGVSADGHITQPNEDIRAVALHVTPRFFDVVRIPVTSGRAFDDRDREGAPQVAVVSESFAKYYFGDRPAVGRRFGLDGPASAQQIEIVGTVRDIKLVDLWENAPRMFYRPAAQVPGYLNAIEVRTAGDLGTIGQQLRQVVAEAAPGVPVTGVRSLSGQVDAELREERVLGRLTGLFGGVALLLAAIGLHGVLAYGVVQRTTEIGLRLALGATRRQVSWLVLKQALSWVGAGAILGLAATLALARLLASLLFGVDPIDPATMAAATATLAVVALAAAYWPARRAARLDPLTALRCE